MPAGVKSTDGSQAGTSTSLGRRTQPLVSKNSRYFSRSSSVFILLDSNSNGVVETFGWIEAIESFGTVRRGLHAWHRSRSIAHDTLAAQGIGVSKLATVWRRKPMIWEPSEAAVKKSRCPHHQRSGSDLTIFVLAIGCRRCPSYPNIASSQRACPNPSLA